MSFTSGIGSLQSGVAPIAPSEPKTVAQNDQPNSVAESNQSSLGSVQHGDESNLSTAGALVAQALSGSDSRSEKIASLQQSIAAGTYNVSSSDVADKMLQSLLE